MSSYLTTWKPGLRIISRNDDSRRHKACSYLLGRNDSSSCPSDSSDDDRPGLFAGWILAVWAQTFARMRYQERSRSCRRIYRCCPAMIMFSLRPDALWRGSFNDGVVVFSGGIPIIHLMSVGNIDEVRRTYNGSTKTFGNLADATCRRLHIDFRLRGANFLRAPVLKVAGRQC